MIDLTRIASSTRALKILLCVRDRQALEGRAGLLPGGFPNCIYVHSDQPEKLREIQLQVFNSPFDDMLQEMTRDGYSAEDFKVKNIGNVLAATKACLPRKTEKPCAANVVVFNFGFTEDEDIEYFESVKASTSSASLEDFSICRAISVVTEDEFDVLETRLFENKLTLRKIEYDNGSSLSDIFQK